MNDERERHTLICLILLLLIGIIAIVLASEETEARADTITGEIYLAGIGKALNDFYDRGGELINDEDLELLANVMYHENFCNGREVMMLTGSVVLNRVKCEWYPDSIKEVLYQRGQYATVNEFFTTEIPKEVYQMAKELLIGGSIAPDNVLFQAMFPQGSRVWRLIRGEYFCES